MQKFKALAAAVALSALMAGSTAPTASASGLPSVGQSTAIASAQSSPARVHDYWSKGCFYQHTCLKWSYGYCKRWGHVKAYCQYNHSGKDFSYGGGY